MFDPDWTVSQLRLGLMIIHDLFINKKEEAEYNRKTLVVVGRAMSKAHAKNRSSGQEKSGLGESWSG